MAGRDLSQDLFGTPQAVAEPPAQPPAQGRDLSSELFESPAKPKESKSALDYLMMGAFGPYAAKPVKETIAGAVDTGGGPLPSMAGETIGRVAGTPLGPAGIIVGGALGAGAGELGRQALAGEDLNFKKALIEAGLSGGIGTAFEVVGTVGRRILSRAPSGVKESERLIAQDIQKKAPGMIKTAPREQVKQQFDEVRQSGVRIAGDAFRWKGLSDKEFDMVVREIQRMPAPPGRGNAFGERLARKMLVQRQRPRPRQGGKAPTPDRPEPPLSTPPGQPPVERNVPLPLTAEAAQADPRAFDIGELQDLRSYLMKAASTKKEGAAQDALTVAARTIDQGLDRAIDTGHVSGVNAPEAFTKLKQARRDWRDIIKADDLSTLAESVTSFGKGGRMTMNVGKLKQAVLPGQRTKKGMAARAEEILSEHPDVRQGLQEMIQRYEKVNIDGGQQIAGFADRVTNAVLGVLSVPASRERFFRIVEEQRGTIHFEQLTVLLNQLRREMEGAVGLGESSFFFPPDQQPAYPPR